MFTASELAGFFATHAIWCVSDVETLIPMLAYTNEDKDGPKVVLPAFGGRTADQIATGEWQLPRPVEQAENSAKILEFHPRHLVSALAESISMRMPRQGSAEQGRRRVPEEVRSGSRS